MEQDLFLNIVLQYCMEDTMIEVFSDEDSLNDFYYVGTVQDFYEFGYHINDYTLLSINHGKELITFVVY